jgi:hypothetical protein
MNNTFNFDEPSWPARVFLASVPQGLLLDIPRVVRDATRQAYLRDSDLLPGVRRDKFPIDRRALVETSVHALATRYAGHGVTAMEKTNKTHNYSHIELVSGCVVMIPAAVEADDSLVRDADYRTSLAKNPQLAFSGAGFHPDATPRGDGLLAVVLYGPSSHYPNAAEDLGPAFVVVRFPADDWSCYVEGRVDLLGRLADSEKAKGDALRVELRSQEGQQEAR